MKKHKVKETSAKFTCHVCGKSFGKEHALKGHMKCHDIGPQWSQCDICQMFYSDVPSHKKKSHKTEPDVMEECPVCQKMVTRLKRHTKRNHTGEKYPCLICGREFKTTASLAMHMAIHMGVRFPCFFCTETYGASSNRLKHMQRKHTDEYAEHRRKQEEAKRGHNPYPKKEESTEAASAM